MLRALIWKDVRVNRIPLVLAAALVVASYSAMAILAAIDPMASAQLWGRRLCTIVLVGSMACHVSAQLSLAVLSGNLIAAERVDRSAEFLAYLPPSRGMVLLAKGVLLAGVTIVLLLIHLGGIGLAARFGGLPSGAESGFDLSSTVTIFAVGFCASGIGWLASCGLSSNAAAILIAIAAPMLVAITVQLSALVIDRPESMPSNMVAAWLSVGVAGFLCGTNHYLRRVEP
jgi:hypothetical protein